jgi:hypothetical protein
MTERQGRNDRGRSRDAEDNRPVRRTDDRPASRDAETVSPGTLGADQPVAAGEGASALPAQQVSVETDTIAATLVDVPLVDVREVAYDHQIDPARREAGDTTQPVALFDLHNVGHHPITWASSRTQFVGTDGYTYKPAQLAIDPGELGPGIHTRRVEIRPGRRARVATLVEQLPAGVEIAEVVQRVSVAAAGADTEQLVFDLAE